jgi:hypothetical protein
LKLLRERAEMLAGGLGAGDRFQLGLHPVEPLFQRLQLRTRQVLRLLRQRLRQLVELAVETL